MTPEQIKKWFKRWCIKTKRSGGVLVGPSIQEVLIAFYQHLNTTNNETQETTQAD